MSAVSATSSIKVAASIQPVEMQHAAILNFVLGKYPVPNAFSPLVGARTLTDPHSPVVGPGRTRGPATGAPTR